MKRNLNALCACTLLLVALSSGCSKKEEPQQAPPPTPAAQPAPPAAQPQAPVQKQVTSAAQQAGSPLDFRRRSDPFKPYAPALPAPAGQAPQTPQRPPEDALPIQSFEVAKFKVAGIIAGLTENRALVLDPNGKGYVVQRGMLIGNNNGRIARITSNSVEVVETYREDTGRTRKRTIVLTLTKKR